MDLVNYQHKYGINAFEMDNHLIAYQIIHQTGIRKGTCLEIGGGSLSVPFSRMTEMHVLLLKQESFRMKKWIDHLDVNELQSKVRLIAGEPNRLPIESDSVNLVVSRGQFYFWRDRLRVIQEIFRVLVPGGQAYIGGGLSLSKYMSRNTNSKYKRVNQRYYMTAFNKLNAQLVNDFNYVIYQSGFGKMEVAYDDDGPWLIIRKPIG